MRLLPEGVQLDNKTTHIRETKSENEFAAVNGAGKSLVTVKSDSAEHAREEAIARLKKKKGAFEEWKDAGSRIVNQKVDPSPPSDKAEEFFEESKFDSLTDEQINERFTDVVAKSKPGVENFIQFLQSARLPGKINVVDSVHEDRRYVQIEDRFAVGVRTHDGGWCLLREEDDFLGESVGYQSLNDAQQYFSVLAPGKTEIWYVNNKGFREFIHGDKLPSIENLEKTHILLGKIRGIDLEETYRIMQAEFWSPEGEAAPLLQKLGLKHTSMSIGDVIKTGGKYFVVSSRGFKNLDEEIS